MASEKLGISAAIEATHTPPKGEDKSLQPDLLPETTEKGEKGREEAPSFELKSGEPRGAGRPPGSTNKNTKKMVELLGARHGKLPIEELVRLGMSTPQELEKELGVSLSKAVSVKVGALIASLPYTSQKLPQEIDLTNTANVQIVIGDVSAEDMNHFETDGTSRILDQIAQGPLIEQEPAAQNNNEQNQ